MRQLVSAASPPLRSIKEADVCTRETPPAERVLCSCWTRRGVAAVVFAAGMVLGIAALSPSFEGMAFAGGGVVAVVILAAAAALNPGAGLWLVSRTHHRVPAASPAPERGPALEDPPEVWWADARARGGDGARL